MEILTSGSRRMLVRYQKGEIIHEKMKRNAHWISQRNYMISTGFSECPTGIPTIETLILTGKTNEGDTILATYTMC